MTSRIAAALLATVALMACSSGGGSGPRPAPVPPVTTATVSLDTAYGTASLTVYHGCSVDADLVRRSLDRGVAALSAANGRDISRELRVEGLRIVIGPPDRIICAKGDPPQFITYEQTPDCQGRTAVGTVESDPHRQAIYAVCDYTSRQAGDRIQYHSPGVIDHELGHLACRWLHLRCDCALVGHRPGFDLGCRPR